MTTRALWQSSAAAMLLLASACSLLLPERHTAPQPAVLEHYGDAAQVTVPETAPAGVPATVQVVSYGGGCIREGFTDVVTEGMTVDVRPFDFHTTGEKVVCTAELALFRRDVQLRFDQPGTATIRIHGRRMPGEEPVTITRTLIIQ